MGVQSSIYNALSNESATKLSCWAVLISLFVDGNFIYLAFKVQRTLLTLCIVWFAAKAAIRGNIIRAEKSDTDFGFFWGKYTFSEHTNFLHSISSVISLYDLLSGIILPCSHLHNLQVSYKKNQWYNNAVLLIVGTLMKWHHSH